MHIHGSTHHMLPAWMDSGRMHDHSAARLQEFHMADGLAAAMQPLSRHLCFWIRPCLVGKIWVFLATVTISFLFDKHCLIIE